MKLILVIFIVLFFSCENKKSEALETLKTDSSSVDEKFKSNNEPSKSINYEEERLLDSIRENKIDTSIFCLQLSNLTRIDTSIYKYYKDTIFNRIHLHCVECKGNNLPQGKPLPSKYYKYFKTEEYFVEYQENGFKIYPFYKFKMKENKLGLISRTPSQYSESMLRLIIVNRLGLIESNLELSDGFGDGEWYFMKDGWIENNFTDSFKIVTRKRDKWYEDSEDTNRRVFFYDLMEHYTFNDSCIEKVKGRFILDTLKYRLKYWE